MHPPTPPARRVAALRYQAEQLLRDAAAWGHTVVVIHPCYAGRQPHGEPVIHVIPHEQSRQPAQPRELPQPGGD